jgi:hypothetical protein
VAKQVHYGAASGELPCVPTRVLTRTSPNLQIRRFPYRHPDPFRPVRDLGSVPGRCSWPCGIPKGRPPRWLPAWLPVAEDLADWFGCYRPCGESRYERSRDGERQFAGQLLAGMDGDLCSLPEAGLVVGERYRATLFPAWSTAVMMAFACLVPRTGTAATAGRGT